MKTSDIKRVIDAGLADIETTQRDVDAIMEYIRNTETRKPARKMPLAVAIALVLMLIGAVAFAAMSFLGVFEQIYQINEEEQGDEINNWTFEHKMELLNLLVENGTIFDDEMLMQVYDDELNDEEKGDIIVEMLKKRFAPDDDYWAITALDLLFSEKGLPHQWTHEERVWYHDLIDPPMEERGNWRYALPTENDMPEEEVLEIAYQYFYDNYGLTHDYFDPKRQYTFFQEVIDNDSIHNRCWTIKLNLIGNEYNGQELMLQEVQLSVRNDGSIYDVYGPTVRTWEDDWNDIYCSDGFWTIEGLYSFQNEWKPKVEQLLKDGEILDKVLKYLVSLNFGVPDDSDLPLEKAREIARTTILTQDDWTEEMLQYYNYREAYLAGEPNQYCMLYTLAHIPATEYRNDLWEMNENGKIPYSIRVCIDAQTGNIIEIYQLDQQTDIIETIGI